MNGYTGLLHQFLNEWCQDLAPTRWQRQIHLANNGKPQSDDFSLEKFHMLAAYLRDYLVQPQVCRHVVKRLTDIVTIRLRDEAAARQARRKYTNMVLNDAILYLGPPSEPNVLASGAAGEMTHHHETPRLAPSAHPLIEHWQRHLADCLAGGAGEEAMIPPGNQELCDLIEEWA